MGVETLRRVESMDKMKTLQVSFFALSGLVWVLNIRLSEKNRFFIFIDSLSA